MCRRLPLLAPLRRLDLPLLRRRFLRHWPCTACPIGALPANLPSTALSLRLACLLSLPLLSLLPPVLPHGAAPVLLLFLCLLLLLFAVRLGVRAHPPPPPSGRIPRPLLPPPPLDVRTVVTVIRA